MRPALQPVTVTSASRNRQVGRSPRLRAVAGRADADQVRPAADQPPDLPRLEFPRRRVDPLDEDGVCADRDDPEQVGPEVQGGTLRPALRELRWVGGYEAEERANDLAVK